MQLPARHTRFFKESVLTPRYNTALGAYAGVPRVVEEQQGVRPDAPAAARQAAAAVAAERPAASRCAPCTGSRSSS